MYEFIHVNNDLVSFELSVDPRATAAQVKLRIKTRSKCPEEVLVMQASDVVSGRAVFFATKPLMNLPGCWYHADLEVAGCVCTTFMMKVDACFVSDIIQQNTAVGCDEPCERPMRDLDHCKPTPCPAPCPAEITLCPTEDTRPFRYTPPYAS